MSRPANGHNKAPMGECIPQCFTLSSRCLPLPCCELRLGAFRGCDLSCSGSSYLFVACLVESLAGSWDEGVAGASKGEREWMEGC